MKKTIVILVLTICSVSLFSYSAEASLLRLTADPSVYIGSDSNPWLNESYFTDTESFTLSVINDYKSVKKDLYLNTIEDVYLVIAVRKPTKKTGFEISINGNILDDDDFVDRGGHPRIRRHGVFGRKTYYYDYFIGDLSPQETFDFDISILSDENEGENFFHFDAYGDLVKKGKGCNGDKYKEKPITNPYSHDVTWDPPNPVPEPASMALLGLGLAGFLGLRRKKARG